MKIKTWVFIICLILLTFSFGKSLNPFSKSMLEFHDETQVARVQQFTLNLVNLKIPPRLAPDFSYKMGYPVFNFYAPFSYWITSGINLLGFDIVNSLKLSFLLSIVLAFVFSYLFLRCFFDYFSSLFGAASYASCLYFAIEVFVRGNLGETWFLTLFPLTLYLLYKNSIKPNPKAFFFSVITLSAIYTTHNLLSILFLPVSILFVLILKNKKVNLISIMIGLLLSSYFLVPMIIESPLTYAKQFATLTNFKDHFLCPSQLWQSLWGFGGSIPGCNDGMSFMLGKLQIIFFLIGLSFFVFNSTKKHKEKYFPILLFLAILTIFSLFLTVYQSRFLWDFFAPLDSIIQFPWRFISFSLLGLACFGAYFFNKIHIPGKNTIALICLITIILFNSKYFYRNSMAKNDYKYKYLSQEYIEKQAAYKIAEYLPKTANFLAWKNGVDFNYLLPIQTSELDYQLIKNNPFEKEINVRPGVVKINIHYFPFWNISINGKTYQPNKFDLLGRPIININQPSIINISYRQTLVEMIGDLISLFAIVLTIVIINNKSTWKKIVS